VRALLLLRAACLLLAGLLILLTAGCAAPPPRLLMNGIAADRLAPDGIRALPVPSGPPGRLAGPAAGGGQAVLSPAQRRFLAAGTVPGQTRWQRQLATAALADLRLLTRPNGAVAAAWYGRWKYAWPRDASWVAAALAVTGRTDTALRILRFLARGMTPSGRFAARYQLSGTPVWTGLLPELDDDGWFPWAVWVWYASAAGPGPGRTASSRAAVRGELAALWPAVSRSADYATASLGPDGLPSPSPDYWEQRVSQPTIGTAAPLLAGLRAAARLAGAAGPGAAAAGRRFAAAAARLRRGITAEFGPAFPRYPAAFGGPADYVALFGTGPGQGQAGAAALSVLNGPDSAVTFLGPPFAAPDPAISAAIARAARALTLPNGGILPGTTWHGSRTTAWTPSTGFFALSDAASGRRAAAVRWLAWLAGHRTTAGELPEQVGGRGQPVSVAPLAWTDAIVLLTLSALAHPLPVP
jgi:glucoamylase